MSQWCDLKIEEAVVDVLKTVEYDHHFGRPFISAYQLAIALDEKHGYAKKLELEIGGAGTGSRNSLAQYLAGELSRRIRSDKISCIEGAFLSNLHLHDVQFQVPDRSEPICSSLTDSGYPLSLFRLRDDRQK